MASLEKAFPQMSVDPWRQMHQLGGMSLRDYFAAKAMAAMLSNVYLSHTDSEVARWSYEQADAMLAEREKTGGAQ